MSRNTPIFSIGSPQRNDDYTLEIKPFVEPADDTPKNQPRTHLVSCAADASHSHLLHIPATTFSDSEVPQRGRDYTETAVPGAYPAKALRPVIAELVTRFPTEQVLVVTHSDQCGLVDAVRKYIANPDVLPTEFGSAAEEVAKKFLLLDFPSEAIKSWDAREIGRQLAVVVASDLSLSFKKRLKQLTEDNPHPDADTQRKIDILENLRIAAYVSHDVERHPVPVLDLQKVSKVADFARQSNASARANLGL